ncbi:MAG: hypothetical protein AABM64_00735 [Pseudomonadota bacterium]
MDPHIRALLEAPIAPTPLRLAAPNMLAPVAQAVAGVAWFGSLIAMTAMQRRSAI